MKGWVAKANIGALIDFYARRGRKKRKRTRIYKSVFKYKLQENMSAYRRRSGLQYYLKQRIVYIGAVSQTQWSNARESDKLPTFLKRKKEIRIDNC